MPEKKLISFAKISFRESPHSSDVFFGLATSRRAYTRGATRHCASLSYVRLDFNLSTERYKEKP